MKVHNGFWLATVLNGLLAATSLGAGVSGNLQLVPFRSSVFHNQRMLRIWLPAGYSAEAEHNHRYPVLYLNDGQNLFDAATSMYSEHEWQVDETMAALIKDGSIPPAIVVGIDNAGRKLRPTEYLPWEDIYLKPPVPEPHGKLYPRLLLKEVLPFVEARYRVRTDPGGRLLGGSSYGALIALFTVVTNPGKFGMLLLESPSLYVDDAKVLELSRQLKMWPALVYLGVGTHEGRSSCDEEENREAIDDVLRLERIIRKNAPATRLKVFVEKCGLHNEEAYGRRLPAALQFLLGRRPSRAAGK
jgi:predicted alpha/beta superfamily hydrolase